jgi:hypothetical protein
MCLSSCEADKFSPAKRKGCGDKNIAKAFEAIIESSWVSPITTTNIT